MINRVRAPGIRKAYGALRIGRRAASVFGICLVLVFAGAKLTWSKTNERLAAVTFETCPKGVHLRSDVVGQANVSVPRLYVVASNSYDGTEYANVSGTIGIERSGSCALGGAGTPTRVSATRADRSENPLAGETQIKPELVSTADDTAPFGTKPAVDIASFGTKRDAPIWLPPDVLAKLPPSFIGSNDLAVEKAVRSDASLANILAILMAAQGKALAITIRFSDGTSAQYAVVGIPTDPGTGQKSVLLQWTGIAFDENDNGFDKHDNRINRDGTRLFLVRPATP